MANTPPANGAGASTTDSPVIQTKGLTYSFPDFSTGISDITLDLPAGSRTLLIGANGAGKTTLLRLLAGKRLAPKESIRIQGVDPFSRGLEGVTYLGLEWVLNPVVRRDIGVDELLASVGGDAYPARRDELVSVLDIDTSWRMHAVSDGERRRVQLAMGLVRPWRVLLLDEITVDLDVWTRAQFLGWLRQECERHPDRAAGLPPPTIVYATHILDHLAGWPTHLVHMHMGTVREWGPASRFLDDPTYVQQRLLKQQQRDAAAAASNNNEVDGRHTGKNSPALSMLGASGNSRLGDLVLAWLREDLRDRGPRSQNKRGPEGLSYLVQGIGGYGLEVWSKDDGAPDKVERPSEE
ncbi:CCR4-NOT complex subunit CAF16 [Sporothrix schenckii 1099-18]|uniref:CCR4-NOT complex subunit CAF16 n=1 Tax=Sporothrix schenckii 1099-18 TaxID=1397361 RepID=A0A0F2M7I1_SPOSC|nr:CCR4-NOT complex subunit CAF16 [Sporothrix schenckii 1099-18]KJR84785.1 CCR4-NOT complex subunit CAF16 [Sporothrix schenckii 1099-18]